MLAKAKYRKDYKQPDFTVTDIFLDFQLDPKHTVVTAKTTFQRLNDEATHLRLDGHGFQFASIKFNGEDFKHYHQDHESLTLDLTNQSAVNFELEIVYKCPRQIDKALVKRCFVQALNSSQFQVQN